MGQTDLATGQLYKALSEFEKLAADQPKNPVLLLELGKTYRLLGDYANASLALKGAIEYTESGELAVEASEELKKMYH
jgi:Flp pilus assembly protein TadD